MLIFQWCKTQVLCFMVLAYVGLIYIKDGRHLNRIMGRSNCNVLFDSLLVFANIALMFDAVTACTVNMTDDVPRMLNLWLHFGMYVSYEIFVCLLFWYWVSVTVGIPKGRLYELLGFLPPALVCVFTGCLMPMTEFLIGEHSNYSMGPAVYVCYACIGVYCILTIGMIIINRRLIPAKKRNSLAATVLFIAAIVTLQGILPELLLSGMAAVMIIVSIYLTMENPSIKGLEYYQEEMVMGFATLVENKDDSTGGHIRRSSEYAKLIAENLMKKPKYKNIITRDYLNNLIQAAPMHDIGKIGIPDSILQKPGRLTDEEFEIMKKHAAKGGKIIEDTFGNLFNMDYENIAYNVARHHHEKWNGRGYPDGLAGEDIPLCARIMAVADVFDAVSTKRCYRDAMELDECYDIIIKGRGTDFDPDIADAFLEDRDAVEAILHRNRH